jgi:hypothetical protein
VFCKKSIKQKRRGGGRGEKVKFNIFSSPWFSKLLILNNIEKYIFYIKTLKIFILFFIIRVSIYIPEFSGGFIF